MSKQLAISSAFAVFAMAAMTLNMTPARSDLRAGADLFETAVELPEFQAPNLPLLSGN